MVAAATLPCVPKRPREHVLEDESRRALEAIMPAGWVVRPVDRGDYGVDAEIEVFESGLSTGLTFKVQLKATDARRSPSVRVTAEHLRYWVSLDVPSCSSSTAA